MGNGALDALLASSTSLRDQLDRVTEQTSTGLVSQTYGGLGAPAQTSLNLAPQVAHATAYQANIDAATGRMNIAQTALSQIADIANTLKANLAKLNGVNAQEVDGVAADARSALQQVAGLLDSKVGDTFVFAGQDTTTPPVANPDSILGSAFYAGVQGAVANLNIAGAAATAAATLAVASPVTASGPAPTVEAGPGLRVQVGVLASANTLATSSGPSTTGSYIHDLMRALATVGAMSSAQAGTSAFTALVQDTNASMGGAISAMGTETGALGDLQSSLASQKTQLAATQTALTAQVSSAQDVDMAATLTKLSALQSQLQASYKVIAELQGLTLASVLPG